MAELYKKKFARANNRDVMDIIGDLSENLAKHYAEHDDLAVVCVWNIAAVGAFADSDDMDSDDIYNSRTERIGIPKSPDEYADIENKLKQAAMFEALMVFTVPNDMHVKSVQAGFFGTLIKTMIQCDIYRGELSIHAEHYA